MQGAEIGVLPKAPPPCPLLLLPVYYLLDGDHFLPEFFFILLRFLPCHWEPLDSVGPLIWNPGRPLLYHSGRSFVLILTH